MDLVAATRSNVLAYIPSGILRGGPEMRRKIFRTGNRIVVSLPKDALDFLGIAEGSEVTEFIERYRPALEALAK